jgi:(1->4)-alpha-D-glucan 1-alpha-D-glucosylmutase
MGIAAGNALWEDVLENGPAALHAHFFDIEWDPVKAELRNKVLLPILGDQYGVVLDRGELQLEYQGGSIWLRYFDRRLPLNPRAYQDVLAPGVDQVGAQLGENHPDHVELQSILTGLRNLPSRGDTAPEKVQERSREKEVLKRRLNAVVSSSPVVAEHLRANLERLNGSANDPRSFDALDRLFERYVPYRLAHWRVAGEEINYRRFFDINSLAAIRVEDEDVFEEAHALTFQLLARGMVNGLRVDHPDGLFDPSGYFLRLQEQYFIDQAQKLAGDTQDDASWPAVAEALSRRWRVEAAAIPRLRSATRSTSWWRRSRAAGSASPTTGRCTAPPGTASPTSPPACWWTRPRAASSPTSTRSSSDTRSASSSCWWTRRSR